MKDDRIVFYKDSHTYWLGNRRLSSVGSWMKQYIPEFRSSYWLTHGVLKEMIGDEYVEHYRSFKKFGPPAEDLFPYFLEKVDAVEFLDKKRKLQEVWDRKRNEAAWKGTRFHDYMEAEAYADTELTHPWSGEAISVQVYEKEYDNESLTLDLSTLPDGVYLELLVFDVKTGVAGQADMVFIETIGDVRYIDINDHKTNEKKPSKSAPTYCVAPFDGQYASTHFKYVLQINAYARLLELHGFTPRDLAYTYYKNYDKDTAQLVDVEHLPNRSTIFS